MRDVIRNVTSRQEEQVVLECVAFTPEFEDIRNYCLSKEKSLIGMTGSTQRPVYYDEILYIEAVDEKTFAYTETSVFELRTRLYKLEEQLRSEKFVRCSKAFLISLMKVESIRPAINGRYCARMKNGEEVIISRRYVRQVKRQIKEELTWNLKNF